jgi:hypothetical protein
MVVVLKFVRFASKLEELEIMVVVELLAEEVVVYSVAVQEHLYILFLVLGDIAF